MREQALIGERALTGVQALTGEQALTGVQVLGVSPPLMALKAWAQRGGGPTALQLPPCSKACMMHRLLGGAGAGVSASGRCSSSRHCP